MEKTEVTVRNIKFNLITSNRSLLLCARMNYEIENLDFIDEIPTGENFLDLGACEGRFSIYAAQKGLKVLSVEPDKYNFQVLKDNLKINSLSNVIPLNVAIGEKSETKNLLIGQPWPGGHHKIVETKSPIRHDLNFEIKEKVQIEVRNLEWVITTFNFIPSYIKIDIDGSEISFLKGAVRSFELYPSIKGLIFELKVSDPTFPEIITTLQDKGFVEKSRHQVPNEEGLYNIIFYR